MVVNIVVTSFFALLLGMCLGYSLSLKKGVDVIENVDAWITATNSETWINTKYYYEIKNDYKKLLEEYNQYKGMIEAIKDFKK